MILVSCSLRALLCAVSLAITFCRVLVWTHFSQTQFQNRQYLLCPLSGILRPWFLHRAQFGAVRGLKVLEALRLPSLAGLFGLEVVNESGQEDISSGWLNAPLLIITCDQILDADGRESPAAWTRVKFQIGTSYLTRRRARCILHSDAPWRRIRSR